jgi:hypothetical protein
MADGPKLTLAGKLFIVLFFAGCVYGAYRLINGGGHGPEKDPAKADGGRADGGSPNAGASGKTGGASVDVQGPAVEFGLAYGTEKETWLKWAVTQFATTDAGQKIKVNLIPKGSLEGAQAIWRDKDKRIHVWSPASSLYKDIFVQNWQTENGGASPIAKEENLALSPMVFVMWEERYPAFMQKYKTISFETIGRALDEKAGWDAIAMQPDWGLFKFGHTHPNQSNSGLMALVLMSYDYHKKTHGLTQKDLLNPAFQDWLVGIEKGTSGLLPSTGTMMKNMVLYGPSTYDALFVYESVVIDYLPKAEGKWGGIHVVYPKLNMWNENPYYILDVPWSDAEHRKAAEAFLEFLMSDTVQREALHHGFRPGNPNVAIKDVPESPFVMYEKSGLRVDLPSVCEAPSGAVVNTLIEIWEKRVGKK